MRTIVTGIIVFILWSVLCTWYYVTRIKGPALQEGVTTEQISSEMTSEAPEPDSLMIEPEPEVKSPGPFTVFHPFDRSSIIPNGEFDSYIESLKTYSEQGEPSGINVIGHTDHIGSEEYNLWLGQRRAETTRDYLVSRGVPAGLITTSSRGETAPSASNESESGRAQNRRTEIQIVD
jgi:outer membrane protein OmpA-like peptidoglycan-associated protein